ncbi:hypothetical protein HK405_009111, partial [Cladochytrium tenue]
SCEPCRVRKIKCDGVRPVCGNCIKRAIKRCVFLGTKTKVDVELAERNKLEIEERERLRLASSATSNNPPLAPSYAPQPLISTLPSGEYTHHLSSRDHAWQNSQIVDDEARENGTRIQPISLQSSEAADHHKAESTKSPPAAIAPDAGIRDRGNRSQPPMIPTTGHSNYAPVASTVDPEGRPRVDIKPATSLEQSDGRRHSPESAAALPPYLSNHRGSPRHERAPPLSHPAPSRWRPDPIRPPKELVSLLHGGFFGAIDVVVDPDTSASVAAADGGTESTDAVVERPGAPPGEERMLVDNFFLHYYSTVSYIHKRSYLSKLHLMNPFLRLAICAAGAAFSSMGLFSAGGEWYYKKARLQIVPFFQRPSVQTVQAYMIMAWAKLLGIDNEIVPEVLSDDWVETEVAAVFSSIPAVFAEHSPIKRPICREDIWTSFRDPTTLVTVHREHRHADDNYFTYCVGLWDLFLKIHASPERADYLKRVDFVVDMPAIEASLGVTKDLEAWLGQLPPKFWIRLEDDWVFQAVHSTASSWRELCGMYILYHGLVCSSTRHATLAFLETVSSKRMPWQDPTTAGGGSGERGDQRTRVGSLPRLSRALATAGPNSVLEAAAHKALTSAESIAILVSLLLRAKANVAELAPSTLLFVFEAAVTVFLLEMAIPFVPMSFALNSFTTDTAASHLLDMSAYFSAAGSRWAPAAPVAVIIDRLRNLMLQQQIRHQQHLHQVQTLRDKQQQQAALPRARAARASAVAAVPTPKPTPQQGEGLQSGSGGEPVPVEPKLKRDPGPCSGSGRGGGDSASERGCGAGAGDGDGNENENDDDDAAADDDADGPPPVLDVPIEILRRDEVSWRVVRRVCTSSFADIVDTLNLVADLAAKVFGLAPGRAMPLPALTS